MYDYLLAEYPNAVMNVDTARPGLVKVQFNVNSSFADRSGTELSKIICLTIDELPLIRHKDEWTYFMAQKLIKEFGNGFNKLNSSRCSSFHG